MQSSQNSNLQPVHQADFMLDINPENSYRNYKELHSIAKAAEEDVSNIQPNFLGFVGGLATYRTINEAARTLGVLNAFNSKTEREYAMGSEASLIAYDGAKLEYIKRQQEQAIANEKRQYDKELGLVLDAFNVRFANDLEVNHFDSLSAFNMVNFIGQYADKLAEEKTLAYIFKKGESTIIFANQYEQWYPIGVGRMNSRIGTEVKEPYAVRINKPDGDETVIDFLRVQKTGNFKQRPDYDGPNNDSNHPSEIKKAIRSDMKLATSQVLDAPKGEFRIDYNYPPVSKIIVKKNGKISVMQEDHGIPTHVLERDGTFTVIPPSTGKHKGYREKSVIKKSRIDSMCRRLIQGVIEV